MLKKDSGVTMVSLIIIVIVLFILSGISLNYGFGSITEIRAERIYSYLNLVKAKAEVIKEKNTFNGESLVGEENNPDFLSGTGWYKWDKTILHSQDLDENMLGNDEYFYVNYDTGEVAYSKPTKCNSEICYTLTQYKKAIQGD